jgi:pyruvate dehydrogenase E2 component (dihydrolipoyllysine-residue acetyltransferase)
MAEVIRMPRMSDTMTEGVIVEWHKKVGDKIEPGDILGEVETDKATMELESYQEGTLLYIGVEPGSAVPVEGILAVLGEKGENIDELLKQENGVKADSNEVSIDSEVKVEETKQVESPATSIQSIKSEKDIQPTSRIKASPLAKKIAGENGINLQNISGTGSDGRIVKRDIENYKPEETSKRTVLPQITMQESHEDVNLSQMRKTIARRLAESKYSAPHFYLNMEVNMAKAVEARKSMNEISPVKISFNDLIIKATAMSIRQNPGVNASWLGDKIRYSHHIHIGMAVAIEDGLIVPVVKFADNKSLAHIATESKELGAKAKNKKLQPDEFEGNTFTISNLGMFGIDDFTSIINSPDSCIMAIGTIKQKPVVENGEIKIAPMMKVTLSCDHRVVDGATGSRFLQTFKSLLEEPVRLLV